MATLEPLSHHAADRQKKQECYLCGKTPAETPERVLTKDHLPPQNLFLSPRPSNLITMPCCYACNNRAHKDDEYLRLAVTGYYNSNALGKETRKQTTRPTIKAGRIRQEVDAMRASFKTIALITPKGVEDAVEV